MALAGPLSVFVIGLLTVPTIFVFNRLSFMKDPFFMCVVGSMVFSLVVLIPFLVVRNRPQKTDTFFYALGLLTLSCVGKLVVALENDGIIADMMTYYLREGEPYLKTAHGTLICYWDGVVHFAMYLMIMAAQSWNQSYRDVGLYWSASFGHSLLIQLAGIFVGPHDIRWACLLNVPFAVIAFYFGAKFYFQERPEEDLVIPKTTQPVSTSIWKRPLDFLFVVYFVAASFVAGLRYSAAMGSGVRLPQSYLHNVEPYLDDPSAFSKVQMMVHLFYSVPYYVAAVYGLLWPGHTWMLDWSLLHAGAAAQGQFAHIGASFHYRTPFSYRVPQNGRARALFWLINGSLIVVPQLLAYRCLNFPGFFVRPPAASPENHTDGVANTKGKNKLY